MEIVNNGKIPQSTVFGSYGYAWQQLWKHFLYFFVVAIFVIFAEGPASVLHEADNWYEPLTVGIQLLSVAYMMLLLPVFKYGADYLYLRGIRNEPMEIGLLFAGFRNNYLHIVMANLLAFVLIGIGIVFLIIPGIILACRLVFVPYIVMDKQLEPLAAIEKSWEMTRGHGWTVFKMALLAIPVFIAGLLCLLVGAFISAMWISASFAALYHAIDKEEEGRLREGGV